jgi:Flp pilus assembly protein TadB
VDHRVHHGLHHLSDQKPSRNPLQREADAFALLIWVVAIALVVALAARYAGLVAALPLLAVGIAAVVHFYFGFTPSRRTRRKRRPYRGPSTKRRRHQDK